MVRFGPDAAYIDLSKLNDPTLLALVEYLQRETTIYENQTVIDADHTIDVDDYMLNVNTADSRTLTLLGRTKYKQGSVFIIRDKSGLAATNNIVIATSNNETINGATSYTISTNYGVCWIRVGLDEFEIIN